MGRGYLKVKKKGNTYESEKKKDVISSELQCDQACHTLSDTHDLHFHWQPVKQSKAK